MSTNKKGSSIWNGFGIFQHFFGGRKESTSEPAEIGPGSIESPEARPEPPQDVSPKAKRPRTDPDTTRSVKSPRKSKSGHGSPQKRLHGNPANSRNKGTVTMQPATRANTEQEQRVNEATFSGPGEEGLDNEAVVDRSLREPKDSCENLGNNAAASQKKALRRSKAVTTDVLYAAERVASALQSGLWPSPFQPMDPDGHEVPFSTQSARLALHLVHMSKVATSLKQFARDVILQSMISANADTGAKQNDISKAFLGTLILLREVMTQNAEAIFGLYALVSGSELDFAEGNQPSPADLTFMQNYTAQTLATSVVLFALDEEANARYIEPFLRSMDAYDGGEEEFSRGLLPVSSRVQNVFVAARPIRGPERAAWAVSFNFNRSLHPIVKANENQTTRKKKGEASDHQTFPEPNVVHLTVLSETP